VDIFPCSYTSAITITISDLSNKSIYGIMLTAERLLTNILLPPHSTVHGSLAVKPEPGNRISRP